eukprot:scaffold1971_cov127-Amphora_coffeaeformis.AAC.7
MGSSNPGGRNVRGGVEEERLGVERHRDPRCTMVLLASLGAIRAWTWTELTGSTLIVKDNKGSSISAATK